MQVVVEVHPWTNALSTGVSPWTLLAPGITLQESAGGNNATTMEAANMTVVAVTGLPDDGLCTPHEHIQGYHATTIWGKGADCSEYNYQSSYGGRCVPARLPLYRSLQTSITQHGMTQNHTYQTMVSMHVKEWQWVVRSCSYLQPAFPLGSLGDLCCKNA